MKNRITRKTLRRAGFLEREARLSALPEAPAHDFSPAFAQAAASVLAKGRRSALARDFANRALAAAAALILTLTAAVAAIPQARAEFLAWVKQDYHDSVIYRFYTNSYLTELPNYELTYIPEGFELIKSDKPFINRYSAFYMNKETNKMFTIGILLYSTSSHIQIIPENGEKLIYENVMVHAFPAEFYPSEDENEDNVLVWMDEKKETAFVISGNIDRSVMMHIAEGVFLAE